jgi:hypothetical protein
VRRAQLATTARLRRLAKVVDGVKFHHEIEVQNVVRSH